MEGWHIVRAGLVEDGTVKDVSRLVKSSIPQRI
jgi:hypothetical protein